MKIIHAKNFEPGILDVYSCGEYQCPADYKYGPAVRDFYIIFYIQSGKGRFTYSDTTYELQAGQGFVVYPNQVVTYEANPSDPWKYTWIRFTGTSAVKYLSDCGFYCSSPILDEMDLDFINSCFKVLMEAENLRAGREDLFRGYLHLLFSYHLEKNSVLKDKTLLKEEYVSTALEFMEVNYSKKITVEDIAKHLGISSKYFWRIFSQSTGHSPLKYLINIRIEKATALLAYTTMRISEISRSVSYDDPLQFSKLFKKAKGISPKDFRERYK
jgi:AraC-like DNA-binding protein